MASIVKQFFRYIKRWMHNPIGERSFPNIAEKMVYGGAGFLGQHIVRELQNINEVTEIRVLDLQPFNKELDYFEKKIVKSFVGDIISMSESTRKAFKNVHTVFHCAAWVSYEYPADKTKLYTTNVEGTRNVINQCLENNVCSLIYTSTAEVCMKPYFKNGFFSVIVNQSESKITPPVDHNQLIFGKYAESKLIGEELVLNADKEKHFSGAGKLRTTALRPTFMYGEGDKRLIPTIIKISSKLGNQIWRIGGSGGRHQFVYAGNVAWGHICASKVLKDNADSIGGLPIFITDDSTISDILFLTLRLCQSNDPTFKCLSTTWWYIPTVISFLFFILFEFLYKYLCKVVPLQRLPISPKSLAVCLGSVIFFSRLRAIVRLDYNPIYKQCQANERSRLYYINLFRLSNSHQKLSIKSS